MNKGFTLIEFIIVFGFIAVLIGGGLIIVDPIAKLQKLNDQRRKSDLLQVAKALNNYYQSFKRYPANPGTCPSSDYRLIRLDGSAANWGESFKPYLNLLPKDPNSKNLYVYFVRCDGQAFYLYASLEQGTKDRKACNQGKTCVSLGVNGVRSNACGGICNFGVSSPNVSP